MTDISVFFDGTGGGNFVNKSFKLRCGIGAHFEGVERGSTPMLSLVMPWTVSCWEQSAFCPISTELFLSVCCSLCGAPDTLVNTMCFRQSPCFVHSQSLGSSYAQVDVAVLLT